MKNDSKNSQRILKVLELVELPPSEKTKKDDKSLIIEDFESEVGIS
jgi:hypothetical protein